MSEISQIPATPRKEVIHGATLYLGDCIDIIPSLSDVSCMITDPPYSSGGMVRGDRTQGVHAKYVQSDSLIGAAHLPFSGDNRDQVGYWYWVSQWLSRTRLIMQPGGICALFTDWRQLPVTSLALQSGGFVWRGVVPWHKPAARLTQGRWANSCEYIVWGTNGPRELKGRPLPGFFSEMPPLGDKREHMTQKPLGVLEKLLVIVDDGEVVFDPFMGSGTTGVACANIGRKFIGIELEPKYFDIACTRIENAYRQQRLFE